MTDEPARGSGTETEDDAPPADAADVERLTERILRGLGLDVRASVHDDADAIQIDLSGADRDYLLSRKGEGLSALQYLLNRIVYRGRRGKKIQVDCGGFRKLREEEIVDIALRTAEKVKAC